MSSICACVAGSRTCAKSLTYPVGCNWDTDSAPAPATQARTTIASPASLQRVFIVVNTLTCAAQSRQASDRNQVSRMRNIAFQQPTKTDSIIQINEGKGRS